MSNNIFINNTYCHSLCWIFATSIFSSWKYLIIHKSINFRSWYARRSIKYVKFHRIWIFWTDCRNQTFYFCWNFLNDNFRWTKFLMIIVNMRICFLKLTIALLWCIILIIYFFDDCSYFYAWLQIRDMLIVYFLNCITFW